MTLVRYRHFLAVAEERHFGRAAHRLGIAQPPLSQSIRRLEEAVGVALFVRTTQTVRLTPAGEAFLPEARVAVAAANRAVELAKAASDARPAVRVGVVSLGLFDALPRLLRSAQTLGFSVRVAYESTNAQLRLLASGALDLGLLSPPFDAPPRLTSALVSADKLVAAFPIDSAPVERRAALALVADRFIHFPREEGPALHDAIVDLFRSRGVTLRQLEVAPASHLATLALVAAGRGTCLVPASLASTVSVAGVVYRDLDIDVPAPVWPLALANMPLAAKSPAARLRARFLRARGSDKDLPNA